MEILKDYLLHICFILFPILLYQVFWLEKNAKNKQRFGHALRLRCLRFMHYFPDS